MSDNGKALALHDTTADRHAKWRERHNVKTIRLTGEAHEALERYKRDNGLRSYSEAVIALASDSQS